MKTITNMESDHPIVSVIMPIKNEEKYIERSLGAVYDQDYPAPLMEILVIDGNSTDRTKEIIDGLAKRSKFQIKVLDNPSGIVPKALNIGIKNAVGEIIIRVDGHCEIQSDYVRECVDHLLSCKVDCVGGVVDTVGETFMAQNIASAMSASFGVGDVDFRVSDGATKLTDSVPFPAYKKTIFERIGLFDEDMLCNEDDEFNYRLLQMGGQILLVGGLKTRYHSRSTLTSLWNQYFRYGLWKVRVMQKHPKQMRLRHFIPALFVITLGISMISIILYPWGWIFLLSLMMLYIFFLLFSVFKLPNRHTLRQIVNILSAIIVLHLSYGSGFITGLVKFWDRWGDKIGKVPDFHNSDPGM